MSNIFFVIEESEIDEVNQSMMKDGDSILLLPRKKIQINKDRGDLINELWSFSCCLHYKDSLLMSEMLTKEKGELFLKERNKEAAMEVFNGYNFSIYSREKRLDFGLFIKGHENIILNFVNDKILCDFKDYIYLMTNDYSFLDENNVLLRKNENDIKKLESPSKKRLIELLDIEHKNNYFFENFKNISYLLIDELFKDILYREPSVIFDLHAIKILCIIEKNKGIDKPSIIEILEAYKIGDKYMCNYIIEDLFDNELIEIHEEKDKESYYIISETGVYVLKNIVEEIKNIDFEEINNDTCNLSKKNFKIKYKETLLSFYESQKNLNKKRGIND